MQYHLRRLNTAEVLGWFIPLLLVITLASVVLITDVKAGLPYLSDPDEPTYWLWATLIKQTGSAASLRGSGYPPGFLYLLILEQALVEVIRGTPLQLADHILVSRYVSVVFALAVVALSGLIVRRMIHSRLAGILAALAVCLDPVFVWQSRRAAAQALWMFFTLLCLLLALHARRPLRYSMLYLSFTSGVLSLLFKYQSGFILLFPFWINLRYSWLERKASLLHFGIMSFLAALLLLWLILGYGIMEIVNTPGSSTRAILARSNLFEFISLKDNLLLIYDKFSGPTFFLVIIVGLLAAVWMSRRQKVNHDWEAISLLAGFCIAFYFLMSLFYRDLLSSWLPVFVALIFLWSIGIRSLSHFAIERFGSICNTSAGRINAAMSGIIVAGFAIPYLQPQFESWQYNIFVTRKMHTNAALGDWFIKNVPQGSRTVVEISTPFNIYAGFPGRKIYHSFVVTSIFQENIDTYRSRGYEYLIWNSQKSPVMDQLEDLASPERATYLNGVTEVLRLTGEQYRGPDIVVFQLEPIQQHVRYLWFTKAISFRGYDLNKIAFEPGDKLELMLYWMSAERTPANYIVFVHLIDPETGQLVTGYDGPPDYGNTPTWKWEGDMQFIRDQRILTIPDDIKPGKYVLRIGMYDADTGERLQVLDLQYEPIGDEVSLGQVHIQRNPLPETMVVKCLLR